MCSGKATHIWPKFETNRRLHVNSPPTNGYPLPPDQTTHCLEFGVVLQAQPPSPEIMTKNRSVLCQSFHCNLHLPSKTLFAPSLIRSIVTLSVDLMRSRGQRHNFQKRCVHLQSKASCITPLQQATSKCCRPVVTWLVFRCFDCPTVPVIRHAWACAMLSSTARYRANKSRIRNHLQQKASLIGILETELGQRRQERKTSQCC